MKRRSKQEEIYCSKVVEIPNVLTVKTIKAAHSGKGIDKPIRNVHIFVDSL
jgi:hypothetical protein